MDIHANKKKFDIYESNYLIAITMIFGSFVAGSTCVGGGAIAFPVMTLVFKINPLTARDFTILIQSLGMTSSSIIIFLCKIKVEKFSLILGTIGGVFGSLIGLLFIASNLKPSSTKIAFASIWFSFSISLFFLNHLKNRDILDEIKKLEKIDIIFLIFSGFCGGILTGMVGSGIDITLFSVLTLKYRISESVATPTSVILMAINSIVTLIWRFIFESYLNLPIKG